VHQDTYPFEVVRLAEITAESRGGKGPIGAECVDAMTTSRPGADAPTDRCIKKAQMPQGAQRNCRISAIRGGA
jgi:hypothetical protein